MPAGEIAASGTPVVLAGPNGAGKTNVLDAISLLSPGRGLRGAKLAEHMRKGPSAHGEALWAVAATVCARRQKPTKSAPDLRSARTAANAAQVHLNGRRPHSTADLARDRADDLADARDGPAVHRKRERAAAFSRPAGVRLRCRPCAAYASRYETAMRERARLLQIRSARSGMARRLWKPKWPKPVSQ